MTATVEEIAIEGIDLDRVPPCNLPVRLLTDGICGKPSTYHVRPRCADCGWLTAKFLCDDCHAKLLDGKVWCPRHGSGIKGLLITWEYL
jgi:hypothetical protein